MSGLLSSLNNNSAALNRHAAGLEITGRNLANVNNASYSRQRIETTAISGPGGLTHTQVNITQLRDTLLDRALVRESATTGSLEAQQEILDQLDATLGERLSGSLGTSLTTATDGASAGLTNAMSDFFNAWDELSVNPSDTTVRQSVIDSAAFLNSMLNDVSDGIDAVEADLDSAVTTDVDRANELLTRISELNGDIARIEARRNGDAGELRDERQAALEELGKLVRVDSANSGTAGMIDVTVTLDTGTTLTLVSGANVSNTLSVAGNTLNAGGNAVSGTGSIQGYLSVRANELNTLRGEMDGLAQQFVTSVNSLYNPAGTGSNFFDPANLTAGTISLASDLTATNLVNSSNGSAGGNDIALAMAALRSQEFDPASDAIGGTFFDHAISSVTNIGRAISDATEKLDHQSVVEGMLREQRASVSGVDQNEEATQMILAQRAFQASARVVTTIDNLLDTLINSMGR